MATIGFFTPVKYGELWGAAIAVVSIIFLVFFAQKLCLALVSAKPISRLNNKLKDKLLNELCLMESSHIVIFSTYKLKNNIYCIDTFFGSPAIIISEDLLRSNNYDFIEQAIKRSVHLIKGSHILMANFSTYLSFLLFLPRYLFKKINLEWFSIIYTYAFHPIILINRSLVKSSYGSISQPEVHKWQNKSVQKKDRVYDKMINELASNFSLYQTEADSLYNVLLYSLRPNLKK